MDGLRRSFTARRLRARASRAALVAVVVTLVGLFAAPGAASAAPSATATGFVKPVLDCVRKNTDGTYTAVLGHTNTSRSTIQVPVGTWNTISPAKANGPQPTVFKPGTVRGAYSVTMTQAEYMGGSYWYLDGSFAYFGWAWTMNGPFCPPSTELPEEGNGTGPAIALTAAGLVGGLMVHRATRRARAVTAGSRGDA
jgi:hypothetical protein